MKESCDRCDRPAEVHDVDPIKGTSVHLCREHAIEAGFDVPQASLDAVIQQNHASAVKASSVERRRAATTCRNCGLTFARFRKTGLLGCSDCYEEFAAKLEPVIARSQNGAVSHVGRVPGSSPDVVDRHALRRTILEELARAVASEQYERAARLRDRLQTLGADGG